MSNMGKVWILCVMVTVTVVHGQADTSTAATISGATSDGFTEPPSPADSGYVSDIDTTSEVGGLFNNSNNITDNADSQKEDLLMQEMLSMERAMSQTSSSVPEDVTMSVESIEDWLNNIDAEMTAVSEVTTSPTNAPIEETSPTNIPTEVSDATTLPTNEPTTLEAVSEPTLEAVDSMAPADFFNWLNNIHPYTDKPAGSVTTLKPGILTGNPGEFRKWIQNARLTSPLTKLYTENVDAFRSWMNSLGNEKRGSNIEHFRKWLNNMQPTRSTTVRTKKPGKLPQKKSMDWMETSQDSVTATEITDAKPHLSTDKLIVVVSVVSGTLVMFSIIITFCYFCKKGDEEKVTETVNSSCDVKCVEEEKTLPDVNVISGDDHCNVFMGIPANNDIWRELQALPSTASVVFTESEKL